MSKFRHFWIAAAMLLAASMLFGSGTAEGGTAGTDTLVIAAKDDWSTFDPYYQISISNRIYNPMLFETLIVTGNGEYLPGLASSWEFNEDLTEITFHLEEGVKFSDGSDFTADDVLFNLERAMDLDEGYHVSDYFRSCLGGEKVDDYTVKVSWAEPSHQIEDAFSRLYLICPETADSVATQPVGTGPYKLVNWMSGNSAVFTKNEYYHKENAPVIENVEIRVISDGQSRVINLLSGDVDIIDSVEAQDVQLLASNDNVTVYENTPPEYKNFSMNILRKPFDNQLVRQAMNYALDREKVRTMVNSGEGDVRYLPIVENSPFYDEEAASYYTFDLDKAKELLAEAGYPDGFDFTITVNMGIDGCLEQAQVYQADLAKIGVNATIEPLESASYFPRLTAGDFDMVSFGTGEPILDPSAYFAGAAVARTSNNFFGITENDTWFPEYKALIDAAETETDDEVRKELYHEILMIMVEQGWTIPVTSTVTKVAANNSVQNFNINNTAGEYHLEFVTIGE